MIQSAGLFSEGAAGGTLLRRSSSMGGGGGGGGGGGYGSSNENTLMQLKKPTINKKDIKIDPEDELKHIQEFLGSDDDDDMDDKDSIKNTLPIMLTDRRFFHGLFPFLILHSYV